MSKRDEIRKAEESRNPVTTTKPATVAPKSSAELYAESLKFSQEAKALVTKHDELMAKAESLLAKAVEAEAEEKAKAKAKAIDGANYTGMVFIPWWSEDGKLCFGIQPDIKK